jgi:hypothetical protein
VTFVDQRMFGLRVRSNRPLPFALPATAGTPDVHCTLGELPPLADEQPIALDRDDAPYTLARTAATYVLTYADATRFAVTRDSIAMTWREPLTFEDACTYLPGAPFALLLRLRGVACLHASAVTLDGRTTAYAGSSGAGKSTLAAMMLARGATLVSEDVLALARSGGGIVALPGYAGIRLWPEAVQLVAGSHDALPIISPTWEKRILEVGEAQFAGEPRALDEVLFLDGDEGSLAPRDAALRLIANAYRPEMLDAAMRQNEFEIFTELADRVPCSTFSATAL